MPLVTMSQNSLTVMKAHQLAGDGERATSTLYINTLHHQPASPSRAVGSITTPLGDGSTKTMSAEDTDEQIQYYFALLAKAMRSSGQRLA